MSLLLPLTPLVSAQVETRLSDEQQRLLEVRRRQIELKEARAALERMRELSAEKLVARADLEKAEVAVETAQLNYQQSVLALLALQPRISIKEAVRYHAPDGRRLVRLTVVNLTPTFDDAQFQLLNNFDGADPIPDALRQRDVADLFVSLKAVGDASNAGEPRGTTIALPYEAHIPKLKYGESRTLRFELLRDVESVLVSSVSKGQATETAVRLQQAATESVVTLSSTQLSQEADLGASATFSLKLERSTVDVRAFELRALDLPRVVSFVFLEENSDARLSQISFPAGVSQSSLRLRLFLPERADDSLPIDKAFEFWVLAADPQRAAGFTATRSYTAEEIEKSRAGFVRLQLVPRGVGRIEVSAPTLYAEVQRGGAIQSEITVRNAGTRRLDNVTLSADGPLNWKTVIEPDVIPALETSREASVALRIQPPANVDVGEYEVRLRTASQADNRPVSTEDKTFRVNVKARPNLLATGALIASLLGLVVGIVVFGIKLTRR